MDDPQKQPDASGQNLTPASGIPTTAPPDTPVDGNNPSAPIANEAVPPSTPASGQDQYAAPSWAGFDPVVPESGDATSVNVPPAAAPETSFVPTGVLPQAHGGPPPPVVGMPVRSSGSPGKKILFILAAIAGLLLIVVVGRVILSRFSGAEQTTITYWGLWEDDIVVQTILQEFQASHPNIVVQYVPNSPKQYRERLQSALSRGDGPDVFRFHNTWVAMLREDLQLVPTSVMSAAEFSSSFFPVASRDLIAGSSIFGIPLMIDGLGLYYNEDLFASAGASPPTTWEDVLGLVQRLTVRNKDEITTSAIAMGTTNNVDHYSDIFALLMMQSGVDMVNPASAESLTAAEQTLEFYRSFADPSDELAYSWNESLDTSVYAFASGRVAMILAPSWRAFDILQINSDIRFRISPVPQVPGHTVTWASYWVEGVSARSKNQEAAWEFVKFLTSRETAVKLYAEASNVRLFGEPYARMDLAASLESDPYVGAYVTQAKDARSFPLASRTFDNGMNDELIKYLEDALNGYFGGMAPNAALETYASGVIQVLGRYGLVSPSAQN